MEIRTSFTGSIGKESKIKNAINQSAEKIINTCFEPVHKSYPLEHSKGKGWEKEITADLDITFEGNIKIIKFRIDKSEAMDFATTSVPASNKNEHFYYEFKEYPDGKKEHLKIDGKIEWWSKDIYLQSRKESASGTGYLTQAKPIYLNLIKGALLQEKNGYLKSLIQTVYDGTSLWQSSPEIMIEVYPRR